MTLWPRMRRMACSILSTGTSAFLTAIPQTLKVCPDLLFQLIALRDLFFQLRYPVRAVF